MSVWWIIIVINSNSQRPVVTYTHPAAWMQAPTDVSTTPPSSSSSSSPASKMGSTLMDYKTHVFNAALEGNLMGLKVRHELPLPGAAGSRTHTSPLCYAIHRVYVVAIPIIIIVVFSQLQCWCYLSEAGGGDTNDKIELGDNVSDKSLLFWCIWSTETMDR